MSMELKDVRCSYGRNEVLCGISFSLNPGEVLFVLGQNGAGKSTLFKCMLGLLGGYEGSIRLDGKEIRSFTPRQLARRAACIPQSHRPVFDYAALDVVLMGAVSAIGAFSTPDKNHMRKAEQTLQELGISHLKDRGYFSLSGGERQLVLIARALMQDAFLLLMDEPVASLDFGNQQRVLKTAAGLTKRGCAVAITSHHPEHAFLYADRVLVLEGGRIAALGPPRDVLTEEMLARIYGVSVRLVDCDTGLKQVRVCVPAF
jgi:iron complex transport system ATP-binding protein